MSPTHSDKLYHFKFVLRLLAYPFNIFYQNIVHYIFIYIFALLACRLNTFFIYCTRFPSNLFDTFFSLITSKKDTIRQIRKLFRKMLSDVF